MMVEEESRHEACFESVRRYLAQLSGLDLTVGNELEQALEVSQNMMGALTLYRDLLKKQARQVRLQGRWAA